MNQRLGRGEDEMNYQRNGPARVGKNFCGRKADRRGLMKQKKGWEGGGKKT